MFIGSNDDLSKRSACYLLVVILVLWLLLHRTNVRRTIIPVPLISNDGTGADSSKGVILIYNHIPKTGSTRVLTVTRTLGTKNEFNVKFVNVSFDNRVFSFMNEFKFRFARNVSHWYNFHPVLFQGTFHFISFSSVGFRQPIYINVIRETLEKLIWHYYFKRHGDDHLLGKVTIYQGDTTTFDDCIQQSSDECHLNRLWLQIPCFCGCENYCWIPGNEEALKRAKENIINSYFLVGTANYLPEYFEMLDSLLPLFFRGASDLFHKDGGKIIRKTKYKAPLKPETVKFFETGKIWEIENEFYNFVQTRFNTLYNDFKRVKNQASSIKLKTKKDKW